MLRLLLPVFLLVFTHATAPAAPPVLPLRFHGLRLWLLLALCGAAPVALLVADFPGVVPHRACFALPGASLSSCLDFYRFFPIFFPPSLWFLGLRVLPLCPLFLVLVGGLLRSGFGASSAGVTFLFLSVPTAFCGDSASFGSPVPFATWSPFGMSQVLLHPLFLSFVRVAAGGLFHFLVGFRSVPLTHSGGTLHSGYRT